MALGEFALIRQYFSSLGHASGVVLGVGDDAAVLDVPQGEQLVVTVDTLVAGVHFPWDASPGDIAHRSLRVNLSDIAAMGAQPRWFTLALTLPEANEVWLQQFSQALSEDAAFFGCALVGGDTTSGPLSITIQLFGTVPTGQALTRSGAYAGDHIYVTGSLGEGAAALSLFDVGNPVLIDSDDERDILLQRFYRPKPRLLDGLHLRELASAALDISDGLMADLGHIAESSGLGANIYFEQLPVAPWLKLLSEPSVIAGWVLAGGDDYELCFTVPQANRQVVDELVAQGEISACCIGQMTPEKGVRCFDKHGTLMRVEASGYQHF
jgi:thiamine-monophosphate kinase